MGKMSSEPMSDWKNASAVIDSHMQSKDHLAAAEKALPPLLVGSKGKI